MRKCGSTEVRKWYGSVLEWKRGNAVRKQYGSELRSGENEWEWKRGNAEMWKCGSAEARKSGSGMEVSWSGSAEMRSSTEVS